MKYNLIVCDPPYSFSDKLKNKKNIKRSAESNYNGTLSATEIYKLDVPSLVNNDWCILALWVPSSMLEDGLKIMNAWGFRLKQTYVWIKTTKNKKISFGMGRLCRQAHELCLIGIHGKKVYKNLKNKSQRSVCMAPNLKHSSKPEDLQNSLDLMFPDATKLEMFARRQRKNWTCVGNEAPASMNEDILVTIENLKQGKDYGETNGKTNI